MKTCGAWRRASPRGHWIETRPEVWADDFIECAEKTPKNLILVVADMVRLNPTLSTAFVAEMARRLQGQCPALAFPLNWIEQQLSEQGQTIEQMVQSEGQQQAVDQVSIGNSINSLRDLDAIDWRTFVETLSVVEQTMRDDPAGVYGGMDFSTRDQYRHVIESVAKRSLLTEHEVAGQAVQLASRNRELHGTDRRSTHVGIFLIDKGLPELERATRMRRSLSASLGQIARKAPLALYFGAIFVIAAAVTIGVVGRIGRNDGLSWTAAVLLFVGASHLGAGLVNWLATLLVKPHRLPRLDFSEGIPPEFRTLVAVPTMLVSPRNVGHLVESLEVHYLANRDENLRFCLLTDFRDAPLQSAGANLAGPRAQTRQARRPECCVTRWLARWVLFDRRRYVAAGWHEVCHHARYRHAPPA